MLFLRNSKQDQVDDQLFADSAEGSKTKKRKAVANEEDEDAFVSVDVSGKVLNIKQAARSNEDLRSCLIF